MTKAEAKALSLEKWEYLAERPECKILDLPDAIYDRLDECYNWCPLCEIYDGCQDCILFKADAGCLGFNSPYIKWNNSPSGEAGNAIRAEAAKRIVDIVKAWDTEAE
jgi:hypothetical protein